MSKNINALKQTVGKTIASVKEVKDDEIHLIFSDGTKLVMSSSWGFKDLPQLPFDAEGDFDGMREYYSCIRANIKPKK